MHVRTICLYAMMCVITALMPFRPAVRCESASDVHAFPGWPEELCGMPLYEIPLSEKEEGFSREFPGRIARFSDGHRQYIVRWVNRVTRKLHPAADCFKGLGYRIVEGPVCLTDDGRVWGSFKALRGNEALEVNELIYDENGNSWSDVSSWFWAAFRGRSNRPWWAITMISAENMP